MLFLSKSLSVATLIGFLLMASALLNGSGIFLKRIGFLENTEYQNYLSSKPFAKQVYWCLHPNLSRQAYREYVAEHFNHLPEYVNDFSYVYEHGNNLILVKRVKDVFVFLLILWLLYQVLRKDKILSSNQWVVTFTMVVVGIIFISTVISYVHFEEIMMQVSGFRSFSFVFIGLLATHFASSDNLRKISGFVALILVIQFLILPLEYSRGMMTPSILCEFHQPVPWRLSGTFVLPNTLGVFIVISLAFFWSFSRQKKLVFCCLVLFSAPAIFLARSGSGALVGLCCLLVILWQQYFMTFFARKPRLKTVFLMIIAVCFIVLIVYLPDIVRRPILYDSLFGRITILRNTLWGHENWLYLFFGQGLGAGTNAALLFFGVPDTGTMQSDFLFEADSSVIALIAQTGLIGVTLFYVTLLGLLIYDPQARIFYLAVILTSLTMNIPELFPVNVLLGFALASSFSRLNKKTISPATQYVG